MYNNELYHYGVKGMKWGVRRSQNGGGIAGAIRRKQRSNAERDLADIKTKQRQVNSELRELNRYERNPQGLAKSKISTAIRRSQIKSLNKTNEKLKQLEKENIDTLKELDSIEKYQAKKRAAKAEQKMAKMKIKDLERQYGELEDQMTYGKNANAKNNSRIESEMAGIESEINKLKSRR